MRDLRIGVIGAGMAGASVAYELALDCKVTVLEQEVQPGFHSTGRSAALFSERYGNRTVRSLTALSKEFFIKPPFEDVQRPLVKPRGALFIASTEQQRQLDMMVVERADDTPANSVLSQKELTDLVPVLTSKWQAGLWERHAMDIDVATLHQAYLRHAKRRGAIVICNSQVTGLARVSGAWRVEVNGALMEFDLIVNAAGAWADTVAGMADLGPLGLVPKRRTAFLFTPPPQTHQQRWPLVLDVGETFYFKPEADLLLGSLADEIPNAAEDVQPDDVDVATAVERIEQATTMQISRVTAAWAGLRTFAPDRSPVVGFDPREQGFFWLAGQGGYGIQMAPALAIASGSLIRHGHLPDSFAQRALDDIAIGPGRLVT